jgi:hypothetical protein
MALDFGTVSAKTLRAAAERIGMQVNSADEERPELPAGLGLVQRAHRAPHAPDTDTLLAVKKDPKAAENLRAQLRAALTLLES